MFEPMNVESSLRLHYASVRDRLGRRIEPVKRVKIEPSPPLKPRDIIVVTNDVLGGRVPEYMSEAARLIMGNEERANIIRSVCATTGITLSEIIGRSRRKPVVEARHEVWVRLYMSGTIPYRISRLFGVDHSAIANAIHKFEREDWA